MRDLCIVFSKCVKYLDNKKIYWFTFIADLGFFSSVRWIYATFNALKKIKLLIFFQGALLHWIPSLSFSKWSLKPLCEALCPANFVSMVTIINVGESTDVKNFSPTISPQRLQQKQDVVEAALNFSFYPFDLIQWMFLLL